MSNQSLGLLTFVVLKGHDVLGAFFEAFKETLDQVSNVFRIGALESELFTPDSGQSESLCKCLGCPDVGSDKGPGNQCN